MLLSLLQAWSALVGRIEAARDGKGALDQEALSAVVAELNRLAEALCANNAAAIGVDALAQESAALVGQALRASKS